MSKVTAINWIAIAAFWVLVISDITTPGEQPKALDVMEELCIYIMIASAFYNLGRERRQKTTSINEMSI